jgi:hypothetical protein
MLITASAQVVNLLDRGARSARRHVPLLCMGTEQPRSSASNMNSPTVSNNASPTVNAKRICKTYMQNVYALKKRFSAN